MNPNDKATWDSISATLGNISKSLGELDTGGTGSSAPKVDTSSGDKLMEALTERLTKQGKGISSSSSSTLQSELEAAMAGVEKSGKLSSQALQSEREREVAFAKERAGATYTTALEGRTGYATQVAGLRELTETTEKSVRDLDKRYQEAILSNDAATAAKVADLRIKKLEFMERQEEQFYSNLFSLGNLQEQALSRQQQNEQFWLDKKQRDEQFKSELEQSKYQFEKNYGLSLSEMSLKEQQLEIERKRFNLSQQEYNDKKRELEDEKTRTYTKAVVANQIKNVLADPDTGKLRTKSQVINTEFMLKVKEETDFDGTTEELAALIREAYDEATSDEDFMSQFNVTEPTPRAKTGLLPRAGRAVSGQVGGITSFLDELLWSGRQSGAGGGSF